MRRSSFALVALALLTGCGGSSAGPGSEPSSGGGSRVSGTVTVFAAASLTETFTALGRQFEADHPGVRVRFSFAASSELATQITEGAPADVFASASRATMAQVTGAGDAVGPATVFVRNRLEIAVPAANPAHVTGLADFAEPRLKIALCAREVPCGAAAVRAFAAAGITPRPDTLEQDVKATLTKVTLGEVDAALVYRTDVTAAGAAVRGIDFPEAAAAVNAYPIVRLAHAPNAATARSWVRFVLSAAASRVFGAAGFGKP